MILNPSIKNIHCIGVGGIGVAALAEILWNSGHRVTGSDCRMGERAIYLRDLGLSIHEGHQTRLDEAVDLVVYSSAITGNNPELKQAKERGIPCFSRGQVMAELFNAKQGIAVVGSHGKTTTTSLVSHLLIDAGFDPSCLVGGIMGGVHSPCIRGDGDWMVVEGDESDRSFLYLKPKIAVVTNIDRDHLVNYNNSYEELLESFVLFLNQLPSDGVAILNGDDPGVQAIIPRLVCRKVITGSDEKADLRLKNYRLEGLRSVFTFRCYGQDYEIVLNLPGHHNIMNALVVCALSLEMKINTNRLRSALKQFPGVGRRFQCRACLPYRGGEVMIIEDYGHHPHAIKVTVEAVIRSWPESRMIMVFQPHRFSRTRDCMQEFVQVLAPLPYVFLVDVYAAGEMPLDGGSSSCLSSALKAHSEGYTRLVESMSVLPEVLSTIVQPGDIILLQGAGDIGSQAQGIESHLLQGSHEL